MSPRVPSAGRVTAFQAAVAVLVSGVLLALSWFAVRAVLPPLEVPVGGGSSGGVSGRAGTSWTFGTTACLAGAGSASITGIDAHEAGGLAVRDWGIAESANAPGVGAVTTPVANIPGYESRTVSRRCGNGEPARLLIEVDGPRGASATLFDLTYEVLGVPRTTVIEWRIGLD